MGDERTETQSELSKSISVARMEAAEQKENGKHLRGWMPSYARKCLFIPGHL